MPGEPSVILVAPSSPPGVVRPRSISPINTQLSLVLPLARTRTDVELEDRSEFPTERGSSSPSRVGYRRSVAATTHTTSIISPFHSGRPRSDSSTTDEHEYGRAPKRRRLDSAGTVITQ